MPTLLAPAKINVTLEILSRREDGYHTLRSVMLPIALYDRIELRPGSGAFAVDDASLAHDNLVSRALAATGFGAAFDTALHKTIPVGGGLGGGSSDAAAVLRAAMSGGLGTPPRCDWPAVARALGSDVPFFLSGTGALVEGTGERVTPIGALPEWWTVVVQPNAFVDTADAYRRLDAFFAPSGGPPSRPRGVSRSLAAVDALQRRDFGALQAALCNDFHDVILGSYPPVARAFTALEAAGAGAPLLSGSGACLFALFEDAAAAAQVAGRVEPSAVRACYAVPFHGDAAWRS